MRKSIVALLFAALSSAAWAQGVPQEQTIELKDGGKIVVQKDGAMRHFDAAGNRVMMKDGQTMEAKDGSKLMMKNNAIWKQITERGTLRP